MRLTISGTVTPDCTTLDTGEPAGIWENYEYWTWAAGGLTFYLYRLGSLETNRYAIYTSLTTGIPALVLGDGFWLGQSGIGKPPGPAPLLGNYSPQGGMSGTVTVTEYTPPADNTPDAFSFAAVTGADLATEQISEPQEITGMDAGTAISITGGEYRLNGGEWTAAAGTIDPGDTLELRQTSSAEPETETTATVTVGTVSVDWSVTTKAGQTLKQHVVVGPSGTINPVGGCIVVPGWV
jgi:hypothetical protein